jgi:nucleoid-associated protein YgaU
VGSVAQAVWEFDEAVQAPWRPPLRAVPGGRRAPLRPVGPPASRPGPTRVGAGRAPVTGGPRTRRAPAAPGGRPSAPGTAPGRPVRAGRPALARGETPGLRLTRRARRLVAVLVLGAGVAVGSWLGALLTGPAEDGLQLVGESSVVVESGDTLWSIAGSVAGSDDVRPVVDAIQELNGLSGTDLVPGQVLRIP